MSRKSHPLDLSSAPIGRVMVRYAVPCIISLLVAALYNIVDQIYIGWGVGAEGNGATNIVFPLTVLALAIATMIGDGACSFISISLGREDPDSARRTVGIAVTLTVLASLVLMAVYLVFRQPILRLFGATDQVSRLTRDYADDYFIWIAAGIPFYMFGQAMNPIIRSDGSPRLAMFATVAGAAANIILDPVAIFLLDWGVAGAAIATVAGQIITAAISLAYLFRMKQVHLRRDSFFPRAALIGKFLPLGFTSFLSQFSLVLSMAVMNNMITKYGVFSAFAENGSADTPLAVQGIVMKFFQIVISIVVGMAAGCIPIVGYNMGAEKKLRVRELFTKLLIAEALVGAVALVLAEGFPRQLIAIFGAANESSYYTDFAIKAFRTYLCMMVLACVNKACFIFLQAVGKALASTLLSMFREVVFGVGFALLLPVFFGLDGVLYSMPVSDILTFLISAVIIVKTYRELHAEEIQRA